MLQIIIKCINNCIQKRTIYIAVIKKQLIAIANNMSLR